MQWVTRFLLGGLIVSAFAVVGDVLRPKGFAGLFGAAPSVALATLSLTLLTQGKQYAALEARSACEYESTSPRSSRSNGMSISRAFCSAASSPLRRGWSPNTSARS